jgi:hypothetical protein
MSDLNGVQGELIDRLIDLLDNAALGERMWYEVGLYAEGLIGGAALKGVVPDTGKEPTPGTVGESVRQQSQLVSREQWFELIQERLIELVQSGIYEPFLVRSIRNEIRRLLADLADTGEKDRTQAQMREALERALADPAELAALRARRTERDPSVAALSDEEIAAQLRRMLESPLLLPTSADEALDRWAAVSEWDRQVAVLLSDEVFDNWLLRSWPGG